MNLRSVHVTLVLVSLARALRAHALDDGVLSLFVWSAMGVIFTPRVPRVPRAIVHAHRGLRFACRRLADRATRGVRAHNYAEADDREVASRVK